MKLVLAVLLGLVFGLAIGERDHNADEQRRSLASWTLYNVVTEHPDHAAIWKQWRAEYDYALVRQ